jgi:U11/U12 small nuclear ribonucleoprotein SNRNP65
MRGQAFVTFPCVEDAVAALAEVHGFVFKGKPLIIQFGKAREGAE